MKTLKLIIPFLFFALLISSCKDHTNDNKSKTGITDSKWINKKVYTTSADGDTQNFSFTASDDWSANSDKSWCVLNKKSGINGINSLSITTSANTTKSTRIATITVGTKNHSSTTSFTISQAPQNYKDKGYTALNQKVDTYLQEKYLWNNEYETLTRNYNQNYKDFLNKTLMSMTTNTLDKKFKNKNDSSLFSYIREKAYISLTTSNILTRTTSSKYKRLTYSFGLFRLQSSFSNAEKNKIKFYIKGVYKDSPASEAGFKRGIIITKINGRRPTLSNYKNDYLSLIEPSSISTVTIEDSKGKSYTLTSKAIYENPILCDTVHTTGSHIIGYLSYQAFDMGFNEELYNVFKKFKSKGVTDLILDLRYNLGGYVKSANLMSTFIAGSNCKNKVFESFRFNATRMKDYSERPKDYFDYNKSDYLNESPSTVALNLKKVYIIISGSSYSASELVINALRGIDENVILIGTTSGGKNVGMESTEITYNGATYELYPITFQSYNAKGESNYSSGFNPNYKLDEANLKGDNYFDSLTDFGDITEPLYAKAATLITGNISKRTKTRTTRNIHSMRSITYTELSHPRLSGMIKINNE